jgi:hypothetical protein
LLPLLALSFLFGTAAAASPSSSSEDETKARSAPAASEFSLTPPEGWKRDSARQEERDRFFHNVKNMGLLVRGMALTADMGCAGVFVSPDGQAYVELYWGDSPVPVEPKLAFAFSPHDVLQEGFQRVGDPAIDPATNNVTQVFTFKHGKAKELYTTRANPNQVRVVTCAGTTEAAFQRYESTCDRIIAGLNVAAAATTSERSEDDQPENPQPFRITAGPYLQDVRKARVTIMWETSQPATSKVRYGLERLTPMGDTFMAEVTYTESVTADQPATIHQITLSGLKQRKLYHYQAISRLASGEEVVSEDAVVRTAPEADTPFTFAVYGDSRRPATGNGQWDTHAKIAEAIHAARPDLVLHTGDLTLNGAQHQRWLSEFFGPAKLLFSDTPVYVAIGNHEARAHWFNEFFAYPPPKNYYSFEFGNTHFVAIDSYETVKGVAEYAVIGRESAEYRWLVDDLKSAKAKWKVVFLHHPIYDSSFQFDPQSIKLREVLAPVFEQYGVDIVFNGHDHLYERSYPIRKGKVDLKHGIPYVTTGGGGAEAHHFLQKKKAEYIAQGRVVPHYCLVEIVDGRLEMKVLDLDARLIDSLAITK